MNWTLHSMVYLTPHSAICQLFVAKLLQFLFISIPVVYHLTKKVPCSIILLRECVGIGRQPRLKILCPLGVRVRSPPLAPSPKIRTNLPCWRWVRILYIFQKCQRNIGTTADGRSEDADTLTYGYTFVTFPARHPPEPYTKTPTRTSHKSPYGQ